MTLGIAARSSARSDTGVFSQGGANSLMKIAAPTLNGTAMSKARKEETTVPKMKGSAPNLLEDRVPGPGDEERGPELPQGGERLPQQHREQEHREEEDQEGEDARGSFEDEVL